MQAYKYAGNAGISGNAGNFAQAHSVSLAFPIAPREYMPLNMNDILNFCGKFNYFELYVQHKLTVCT